VTVATRRIQKFLLAEEITESLDDNDQNLPTDPNEPLIVIKDGTFAWGQESFENDSQKLDNGSEIKEKEEEIEKVTKEHKKAGKKSSKKSGKNGQEGSETKVEDNVSEKEKDN